MNQNKVWYTFFNLNTVFFVSMPLFGYLVVNEKNHFLYNVNERKTLDV